MPVPPFRYDGWLPEGHHKLTWEEIDVVFGGEQGSVRRSVYSNLLEWRNSIRAKKLGGYLILNGSFISNKKEPGDFDLIYVGDEEIERKLATDNEAALLVNYVYCKEQGWGDIFYFSEAAIRKFPGMCRTDGFDFDKVTKVSKGVAEVVI